MINNDFNNMDGVGRYRRPHKKWDALEPLAEGIKGRHEKGYPDLAIAEQINKAYETHPILKNITARDIRQFRTQGSRRGTSPKKGTAAPTTSQQGGSGLAS